MSLSIRSVESNSKVESVGFGLSHRRARSPLGVLARSMPKLSAQARQGLAAELIEEAKSAAKPAVKPKRNPKPAGVSVSKVKARFNSPKAKTKAKQKVQLKMKMQLEIFI